MFVFVQPENESAAHGLSDHAQRHSAEEMVLCLEAL